MADEEQIPTDPATPEGAADTVVEGGAYEVLLTRLKSQSKELRQRLDKLNEKRKEAFGGVQLEIIGSERINTENHCVARDLVGLGDKFIFGYNTQLGLRTEIAIEEVFSVQKWDGVEFSLVEENVLDIGNFGSDLRELYKYYKHARFLQFVKSTSQLLFVFQISERTDDIKVFRFKLGKNFELTYVDDRGDMDYKLPPQRDFEWLGTTRDDHVMGEHPHVSILDKVYVECIGGDLTIKIDNNTDDGKGVYSEPVDNSDQTLDDAAISFAEVGPLILLKIHPYREEHTRYFVYNTITESVDRIDSIGQACVQLPEDHGLIFPRGYYLQNGQTREFDEEVEGMVYLTCIKSPNGEDFLYIFYHRETGSHILLSYNLISKEIANPITCHGYAFYDDGRMTIFKDGETEPRRTHSMQIWQTPFFSDSSAANSKSGDAFLDKIGNRDLVRGVSEGLAICRLIESGNVTLNRFREITVACKALLDGYHWLQAEEVFKVEEVIKLIRGAASSALDEYEKVLRIKKDTKRQFKENEKSVRALILEAESGGHDRLDTFVKLLDEIRISRGKIISLRDLRYADLEAIQKLDDRLSEVNDKLSLDCVDFLLREDSLVPYFESNDQIQQDIKKVETIVDLKRLEENLEALSHDLSLLTDIISNLDIEDATKTAGIIDNISDVYSKVNQTRALAANTRQDLSKSEAAAEFSAQFKLLGQSITNYIGMCDNAEKVDELLTKVMIQVEELESKFSDYDEYAEKLHEKREEAYSAFSNRKQYIEDKRKQKVEALMSSGGRILKGIVTRAETFKEVSEVNAYFASDLMISKLQGIIETLNELEETVKADDLVGQLKKSKDDIMTSLRDKLDLFEGGDNVINLGSYKFSVNTQELELTTVRRGDDMYFHLSGTDYYEAIEDEAFLRTRPMWDQALVSENREVYRGEYLAYRILRDGLENKEGLDTAKLKSLSLNDEELAELVKTYASGSYDEAYERGIHDADATKILHAVLRSYFECGLLRYDSVSRGYAMLYWAMSEDEEYKTNLRSRLASFGNLSRIFERDELVTDYVAEIRDKVQAFCDACNFAPDETAITQAAEFLYYELQDEGELRFTINVLAQDLYKRFNAYLKRKGKLELFKTDVKALKSGASGVIDIVYNWVEAFVETQEPESVDLVWEVVAFIVAEGKLSIDPQKITTYSKVEGLIGQHQNISEGCLDVYLDRFLARMKRYTTKQVPLFHDYQKLRAELTNERRKSMRLDEFKPRIMGAFVRNKLINNVYLNLVGANFAKQMGAVGEAKRTDLMGLLMLISPPGYGKTTLMEYIATRLGLTFMKINGPAIGHRVTSLDPIEAPNATSREELMKLNLAFEMGNNIMVYLDDIQHLNPEFLQKFISLCDAQRKIEGVHKGITKTYDLRGKKVAVVMAGNPYTESGEKFQIPDMLSNRADTSNLGDISSTAKDVFDLSFIENAMTSNTVLSSIASRGMEDIYSLIQIAETGSQEGAELKHNYSADEVNDIVQVLKKLFRVRDVVLKVNAEYIYSAAQQDDYRTEPSFKLQGSYRNMNRLAEKIFPVMTDAEVDQVILDNYYSESQTLTSGAESNFLKFKELTDQLTEEESARWNEIKTEFKRRQVLGGDEDSMSKILLQLADFSNKMGGIRDVLSEAAQAKKTR